MRVRGAAFVVSFVVACGGSSSSAPSSDDADVGFADDTAPSGCVAGEALADDGHCEPAGIPAASCGKGFAPGDDRTCSAILPSDACPPGKMASLGETTCRDVAPCGSSPWGDAPIDATTQFVDQSFAGAKSDGSQSAPWKTIHDAIAAAPYGGLVAIAAGSYVENLLVLRPVRLWGKCPSTVEIVGSTGGIAAIDIRASGVEVHALAVRGAIRGVGVTGANVVLDHLWVHDTADTAIDVESPVAPASVRIEGSLVERARNGGVFVGGATATIDDTTVRDVTPAADGTGGRGVGVQAAGTARGKLSMTSSIVERTREIGVYVSVSDATLEGTLVRDLFASPKTNRGGVGVSVQGKGSDRGALSLSSSVIERCLEEGVYVSGSDATIAATAIRDVAPESDGSYGRGVDVQSTDGRRATLTMQSSVVERCFDIGVFAQASDVTVASSIVRDMQPRKSDGAWGMGICAQFDPATGERSAATISATVVDAANEIGILVFSSEASLDGVLVRGTKARASDGVFGDGVAFVSNPEPATIVRSRLEKNARAGLSEFFGTASVGSTVFECNGLDLDGESSHGIDFALNDEGGNACGCAGARTACQVLSSNLAAPDLASPSN